MGSLSFEILPALGRIRFQGRFQVHDDPAARIAFSDELLEDALGIAEVFGGDAAKDYSSG
jgi:hypothetical protein